MGKTITLCFYQTRGEFMPLLMGQAYRLGLSTRPRKKWHLASDPPFVHIEFLPLRLLTLHNDIDHCTNTFFHKSSKSWVTYCVLPPFKGCVVNCDKIIATKYCFFSVFFLFSFFSVYCALLTLSHILWLKWPRREGRVPFLQIGSQRNFTVVACVVSEPTNSYATYPLANSLNSNSLFRVFFVFVFFKCVFLDSRIQQL